jgi:hypothetical protein
LVEDLRKKLRAGGSEERAINAKAYLKSDLEFYGVPTKLLHAVMLSSLPKRRVARPYSAGGSKERIPVR